MSFLPTEVLLNIFSHLYLFGKSAIRASCKRFHEVVLMPIFEFPVNHLRVYRDISIKNQYYFQKSLQTCAPLPSYLTQRLQPMYVNLRIETFFLHVVLCGVEGCYMCKPCSQWRNVIPPSLYKGLEYLLAEVNLNNMTSFGELEKYVTKRGFGSKYQVKSWLRFIGQKFPESFSSFNVKTAFYLDAPEDDFTSISVNAFACAIFVKSIHIFMNVFMIPHYLYTYRTHINNYYNRYPHFPIVLHHRP